MQHRVSVAQRMHAWRLSPTRETPFRQMASNVAPVMHRTEETGETVPHEKGRQQRAEASTPNREKKSQVMVAQGDTSAIGIAPGQGRTA